MNLYCGGREGDGERWKERETEAGREGEKDRARNWYLKELFAIPHQIFY